jgi:hypothetical protein
MDNTPVVAKVTKMSKNYWWDLLDVTSKDIYDTVSFYNDCAVVAGFPYSKIHMKFGKSLKDYNWYGDVISLTRLICSLEAKPKEFITAQFLYYKKNHSKGREIPSFKTMITPAAIEKWHKYMQELGKETPAYERISKEEMDKFNTLRMKHLIKQYNIQKEEDFFKDPLLISQLSRSFIEKFETYNTLVETGYYKTNFGIDVETLFS